VLNFQQIANRNCFRHGVPLEKRATTSVFKAHRRTSVTAALQCLQVFSPSL
jgi:hypothetical protein